MKRPDSNANAKASESERESMENLHVLIVEDDEDMRVPEAELLRMYGCRVDLAFDGATAVERAIELEPDVILMDLTLPVMDGFQSTRQIRARARQSYRPYIIAISGFSDSASRSRAREVGCDDYMVKPVMDLATRLRGCATIRKNASTTFNSVPSPASSHH